jgi:hypothetical protein
VSSGRYEWQIPSALRAGTAELLLRDQAGATNLAGVNPVDPVPAAPLSADVFEFPSDGEIGNTAAIRWRSDGRLSNTTVTLGGAEIELSPRDSWLSAFR